MVNSILLILMQSYALKLPTWFYETPDQCVVVVVSDSYYEESRIKAMEKAANQQIQLKTSHVEIYGYEALEKSGRSKQFDKFDVVYNTTGVNPQRNVLKELGYVLLDHQRFEKKFIVALFGPEATEFSSDRLELNDKPSWLSQDVQNKQSAVGFGVKNYYMTSNWLSAFKHALFNLASSNNQYVFKNQQQESYTDETSQSKSYYNVQLNFVEASISGVWISHRWIDPADGSCHVKLVVGD